MPKLNLDELADEFMELAGYNSEVKLPEELPEDDGKPAGEFSGRNVKEVDFDFFIGKSFVLTGVGSENVACSKGWGAEHATAFSFVLNNQCYTAMEDPNDGYRSSLSAVWVTRDTTIKNTFAPVKVIGRKCANKNHDVVELVDVETGKVVIEFGTCNTDDYYPGFVGCFTPANMVLNEPEGDRQLRENLKAQARSLSADEYAKRSGATVAHEQWGSW